MRLFMAKIIFTLALMFFFLLDLFFLPIYWFGVMMREASYLCFEMTDENGLCLTMAWWKKGKVAFTVQK